MEGTVGLKLIDKLFIFGFAIFISIKAILINDIGIRVNLEYTELSSIAGMVGLKPIFKFLISVLIAFTSNNEILIIGLII